MTYKHIGFSESIVMKELEKVAYRTNLVQNDPEPEKVVIKLASTNDLFLDTITLAIALRDNGFVKQAEKLEEKALQYKMASNDPNDTDKYNWWQEDGKTLIDHCHQPDDYTEIPSSKGYGLVENQNEIHKILEQVVQHQPMGKAGSQNKEIIAMAINALGQENKLYSTDLQKKIKQYKKNNNLVANLGNAAAIGQIGKNTEDEVLKEFSARMPIYKYAIDIVTSNKDRIHSNKSALQSNAEANKDSLYIITPISSKLDTKNYNDMVNKINNSIELLKNDINKKDSFINLVAEFDKVTNNTIADLQSQETENINQVNQYLKQISGIINSYIDIPFEDDSSLTTIQKNNETLKILNSNIKNKINKNKLAIYLLSKNYEPILPISYSPDWSIIKDKIIESLININKSQLSIKKPEIKQVAELANSLDKKTFQSVEEGLNFFKEINNQILQYINDFKKKTNSEPSNVVTANEKLNVKKSWTTDGGGSTITTPSSGKGYTGTSQKKEPGKILSSEAISAISTMQSLLNELATKSSERPDTKFYANFLSSASKDNGSWGANTKKALDTVKQMISKGITGVDSELLNSNPPGVALTDEQIIDSANNNSKAIMQVMVVAFAENRYADMAYAVSHLDNIPKSIEELSTADEKQGSIKIKENNLSSLYSLKKHLTNNGFSSGV
jgi:hypothetical protein